MNSRQQYNKEISKFLFDQGRSLAQCDVEGCTHLHIDGMYCAIHSRDLNLAMDDWEHEKADLLKTEYNEGFIGMSAGEIQRKIDEAEEDRIDREIKGGL